MSSAANADRVVIVGAGLAGLTAARLLVQAGRPVTVLDKGRGMGGRLAARRMVVGDRTAVFDHGAQFFTVRDERFAQQVRAWQQAGVVREWSRGFPAPGQPYAADGHPRYIGQPAMTALAKDLAQGLELRLEVQVEAVQPRSTGWELALAGGDRLPAEALILTPPLPQSLALLEAGHVALPVEDHQALAGLRYEPCLALLVGLDGPSRLPEPGALQFSAGDLAWMADNQRKGVSPVPGSVTIHASADFSRRHWYSDDQLVQRLLLAAAEPWLASPVRQVQVKRWRYARPETTFPQPFYVVSCQPPLLLAGDAFGGPRLEGAFLSGRQAAQALLAG